MATGIEVADESITAYQNLKLGGRFKYVLFALNKDKTGIIVEKTSSAPDYAAFLNDLPADKCRWAVYDFDFEKEGEGKRKRIGFILWSPDAATVREKMMAAASREALRQKLNGIAFEVQGTDFSEITYDTVLNKALRSTH